MGKGCFIAEYKGRRLIRHNGGHSGFRTLHAQILEDDFDVIVMLTLTTKTFQEALENYFLPK